MDTGERRSLTRRSRLMVGIALLVGGTAVLYWIWHVRIVGNPPQPEVEIPPGEHLYAGLPTSGWRSRLMQPTVSHFWPPHEFLLREHPDLAAVPVLQDLLADPDPRVRQAAACCLGLMPSPEPLVVNLLMGRTPAVQPGCVGVVVVIGPLLVHARSMSGRAGWDKLPAVSLDTWGRTASR